MSNRTTTTTDIIHILPYPRGHETYVWLYRPGQRDAVVDSIGRQASNPELSLTFFDAGELLDRLDEEEGRL